MTHLDTLTPLLGIIAAERTKDRPDLFEEVRQEAMIRAWEVETAKPEAPREYVLAAARRAANDVLRGRPRFGEEGRRGWQDAHDVAGPLTFGEDDSEDEALTLQDDAARVALEHAEASDLRDAVSRAVSRLSEDDRDLVVRRFYLEQTWPEIASTRGRSANAVRVYFDTHLAPLLREALAPYREAAA